MPWTDWVLKKNPLITYLAKDSSQFSGFAASLVQKRSAVFEAAAEKGLDPGPRTFIDRFLEAQKANPKLIDDRQVVVYTMTNIVAGSDTTAISLRAIVYMLLRHPTVLEKLLKDLERANLDFPVTWKQSQDVPYLEAVVQEALRLHPAVGFGLERVVPQKGLRMDDGTIIPGGAQVGMNAWVVHLNPAFGPEPEEFRPERWLKYEDEMEENYRARLAAMKRAYLVFGHGSRTCIGKNISLLEIYKLIPTLLMKFKLELVGGAEKQWKTKNTWFVRQWDMDCYVEER
jgi:cytochrome P450